MRISHRYRFVFFSNPKTGSESVRKILDPYSDIASVPFSEITPDSPFYSHISPREVRDIFRAREWRFDDYARFTCVRNPWARMVSLYEMVKRTSPDPGPFAEWLETVQTDGEGLGGNPKQTWRKYGSYTIENYVRDADGTPLVDTVLRLEELSSKLPQLLKELGIPTGEQAPIKHINAHKHRPHTEYYSPQTIDRVHDMYQSDIERFGYEFAR